VDEFQVILIEISTVKRAQPPLNDTSIVKISDLDSDYLLVDVDDLTEEYNVYTEELYTTCRVLRGDSGRSR